MIEELIAALESLARNPKPPVLIIRGKEQQFCSGADIRWMQESGQQSQEKNIQESQRIADLMQALDQYPGPTVALAEGGIFGGALGLLVVCDFVLASTEAQFGLPEVHLGIAPAIILPYLTRRIPPHLVLQKALSGLKFDALEALRIHLVDEILSPEQLEGKLQRITSDLCVPSPEAQRAIKRLLKNLQQNPGEGVIKEAIKTLSHLKSSDNGQEGLRAFIEKRKPEWK